jgi:hypothetical protein
VALETLLVAGMMHVREVVTLQFVAGPIGLRQQGLLPW